MESTDLVNYAVLNLNKDSFESLKKSLINKYIFFSVIDYNDVTEEILAEKICDYFEKVKLVSFYSFDGLLSYFNKNMNILVGGKISKISKKNPTPSRARRYYDRVGEIIKQKDVTVGQLLEYSRIMFCLYNSIIENNEDEITNFDYSLSTLNIEKIVNSIINGNKKIGKKINKISDILEVHSREIGVLVLVVVIMHKILDSRVLGEYYHE
ncbi:hypothetical protein EII38_05465 [Streptococcus minor]|uniref:Uncharacterized protein n=1 Tax=Streptococcus minor TaxID=229549 RepID=A0A3P1VD06_9STRE|nr:hypothetical protein [Streptococcus minor]RRD31658.1 hypothetical protein EII38_05465 [Streptococcus minor]